VVLSIEHLSKRFPGTQALDDVSFSVEAGEIHGLLGGNGSGKSTLIKILAGVYRGDPGGTLRFAGRELAADAVSLEVARACGLRFVHQNASVFPAMTVAENVAIGAAFPTRMGAVRWGALRRRTRALLERFEISADPDDLMSDLRPADQTMVAIARACQDEEDGLLSVLVLDEPTASLPEHEAGLLMEALRRYVAKGETILYVSHRIEEVLALTDRVTVLRDGRRVITRPTAGLSERQLVEHIVGRPVEDVFSPPDAGRDSEAADTVLEVRGLRGGPLKDVSFAVSRGEVLGVAGLLGSGRTELLQMLFGVFAPDAGTIRLGGEERAIGSPGAAMAAGVAFVPENREEDAAFMDMSVRENLSAAQVGRYWRRGRLDHALERREAEASIRDFGIRTAGDRELISSLSGGNQQKVILARWLRRDPRLLLLDEPTQGVDVGARSDAYALIRAAVERGMAAVLVCSDLEELALASDRVIVLRDGRVTATVTGGDLTRDRLTELAYMTEEAQ
jgi:ribose transport system ATP-binding protein